MSKTTTVVLLLLTLLSNAHKVANVEQLDNYSV
jgi:hypothetical protein